MSSFLPLIFFEAKHTKDSKDFACSTLSLFHLSRAFISVNLCWGLSCFTEKKVKIGLKYKFSKKFFFYLSIFFKCFGDGGPNFGDGVPKMTLGT